MIIQHTDSKYIKEKRIFFLILNNIFIYFSIYTIIYIFKQIAFKILYYILSEKNMKKRFFNL